MCVCVVRVRGLERQLRSKNSWEGVLQEALCVIVIHANAIFTTFYSIFFMTFQWAVQAGFSLSRRFGCYDRICCIFFRAKFCVAGVARTNNRKVFNCFCSCVLICNHALEHVWNAQNVILCPISVDKKFLLATLVASVHWPEKSKNILVIK